MAFKIVAVLGLVTLPFCCWAFGRLARFRYPIPELMALGGMLFLFDESFTIYGGNVKSTMAGEFSFSIALSLAMLGLGLFARGLQTGKYRSWAAIVLALAMLSPRHRADLRRARRGPAVARLDGPDALHVRLGVLGAPALLSAFWVVPFLFNHPYMTDMKYGVPARRARRTRSGTCSSRTRRSATSSSTALAHHRVRRARSSAATSTACGSGMLCLALMAAHLLHPRQPAR